MMRMRQFFPSSNITVRETKDTKTRRKNRTVPRNMFPTLDPQNEINLVFILEELQIQYTRNCA